MQTVFPFLQDLDVYTSVYLHLPSRLHILPEGGALRFRTKSYRLNSCPKCPPGALCNICPAFEDNTYSPLEIITFIFTRRFWISVLVWPLIVLVNISEMIDA